MYLPNTVGKRHKKAFKFIFGDRNLRLRERKGTLFKSKCTEISRIAWPRSKYNFPFFRVHREVFITFQRFWGGIFEKMDFVLSLAKNWPKKLIKNSIAKTSWRQRLNLHLRELETFSTLCLSVFRL